jgi:D-alanyl-D-alanine carboxypeptidase/D-alanyl-D-alanine-endopeptidase (penicillin-binding protein 4)
MPVNRRGSRILAVGLAAAALACVALAVRSSGAANPTAASAALTTPLWSPRRVPELLVDAVGAQRLQSALDADLSSQPASCYVVDEGQQPIAAHNADMPLIPASTEKLLTATAALAVLGPNFQYQTKAVAPAAPQGGTVDRIWLVGSGDPVLATAAFAASLQTTPLTRGDVTTRLETLADGIAAAGVHSVPGGVIGDDSRYDQQRYLPSWPPTYRTDPAIGPLGALTVNDGYRITSGGPVAVDDPAQYAAATLTQLLQARGVQVGPPSAHQAAPATATTVASVSSPPLRDILVSSLRSSDDLAGELLAKELGVHTANQGTTAAGVQAITATLAHLGVPTTGVHLVDGSGLDHGNRVPCATLASVLALAGTPEYQPVLDGLPVAGADGTLAGRLEGTPLAGKLHAKTGSLNGASGLAGFLDTGRPLRFALLVNGDIPDLAAAEAVREPFAVVLATFPNAPIPDALVPAPLAPRRR